MKIMPKTARWYFFATVFLFFRKSYEASAHDPKRIIAMLCDQKISSMVTMHDIRHDCT